MKKYYRALFTSFSLMIATQTACMETALTSYTRQNITTIPLSDGPCDLETYKIFLCNNLYKYYLRQDKNFPSSHNPSMNLERFNASTREMMLISTALDKTPGEDFFKHVQSLSPEDRYLLTVACGEYDHNQQEKVFVPTLIAQIAGISLPTEVVKIIKSHLDQHCWLNQCINSVIKHNTSDLFPTFLWKEKAVTASQKNGAVNVVPSCLVQDGAICYNGPHQRLTDEMHDKKWFINHYKFINESREYRVTDTKPKNSVHTADFNKILLWAVNPKTKMSHHSTIEHKGEIGNVIFSDNGEHIASSSEKDVILSKISVQEDNPCTLENILIDHAEMITDICFNRQSTVIASCSLDIQNKQGNIKIHDCNGNGISSIIQDLCLPLQALFNADGSTLLTRSTNVSKELHYSQIIIYNSAHIECLTPLVQLKRPEDDCFQQAVCSPDGNTWAIATKSGNIMHIRIAGNAYKTTEYTDLPALDDDKKITLLFSPNSLYLIALIPSQPVTKTVIWNNCTHEKITTIDCLDNTDGIGVTPGKELVFTVGTEMCYKRPLFHKEDEHALEWLCDTTLLKLTALRRLHVAHKNNEPIKLYEEEPMFKALQTFPTKPCDVVAFVQKHLPYQVINNDKDVLEVGKDMVTMAQNWWEQLIKKT